MQGLDERKDQFNLYYEIILIVSIYMMFYSYSDLNYLSNDQYNVLYDLTMYINHGCYLKDIILIFNGSLIWYGNQTHCLSMTGIWNPNKTQNNIFEKKTNPKLDENRVLGICKFITITSSCNYLSGKCYFRNT